MAEYPLFGLERATQFTTILNSVVAESLVG